VTLTSKRTGYFAILPPMGIAKPKDSGKCNKEREINLRDISWVEGESWAAPARIGFSRVAKVRRVILRGLLL